VIRAVLDSNIIISALLLQGSVPARVLAAAYALVFECFASDAILSEVLRAFDRDRVRRKYPLDADDIGRLRRFLESDTVRTPITADVLGVATHPEDDLILATAVSAQADYLVTGDRHLLALGMFHGVQIVSPREFLTILDLEGSTA
jgi:putative PIN family toxin of toxin-antitoxin system